MIFLTEEDVRQRCELGQGGEFRLQAGERLTPAATELLRSRNCRVILPFVDHFPKDLELYRILTTKLNEISEGAQK